MQILNTNPQKNKTQISSKKKPLLQSTVIPIHLVLNNGAQKSNHQDTCQITVDGRSESKSESVKEEHTHSLEHCTCLQSPKTNAQRPLILSEQTHPHHNKC